MKLFHLKNSLFVSLLLLVFVASPLYSWETVIDNNADSLKSQKAPSANSWDTVISGGNDNMVDGSYSKSFITDETPANKKMNIIFIQGHDSVALFDNKTKDPETNKKANKYRKDIETMFLGHKVEFHLKPTREQIVPLIRKADVLYNTSHQGDTNYKGMQWFSVTPSESNKQFSKGDNSIFTSGNVKETLRHGKGPKLIIFNLCKSMKPVGVQPENMFSTAFGINKDTEGRVFVGWTNFVVGKTGDRIFKYILEKWSKNSNGESMSFLEAFNLFDWKKEKKEHIFMKFEKAQYVGDPSITIESEENTDDCSLFHENKWVSENKKTSYSFNANKSSFTFSQAGGTSGGGQKGKYTLSGNTLTLDPYMQHSPTCSSTVVAHFKENCSIIEGDRIAGSGCHAAGKRFFWKITRN